MSDCVYCGTATELHIKGVPVCKACSCDLEAGRKPVYREPPEHRVARCRARTPN